MQVVSVRDFGAFVRVPGFDKDGLVHVLQVNHAPSGTVSSQHVHHFLAQLLARQQSGSIPQCRALDIVRDAFAVCVFLTQLGTGRHIERAQDVISEGMTVHVKVRRAVRE